MEENVSLRTWCLIAFKALWLINSLIESLTLRHQGRQHGSVCTYSEWWREWNGRSDGKMKRECSEKSRVLNSSSVPCFGFS